MFKNSPLSKISPASGLAKAKLIVLLFILILLALSYTFRTKIFGDGLIRICPIEMVINDKSGVDRSGESIEEGGVSGAPTRSSYYIDKGGERREVDEFDIAWVSINCQVPVTNIQ